MRIWIISREEKIIETDKYKRTEKVEICILRRREIFRGGVLVVCKSDAVSVGNTLSDHRLFRFPRAFPTKQ